MEQIQELTTFLQGIIIASAVGRIAYCCIAIQSAEDDSQYRRRIKNVLIFVVISICFAEFMETIFSYFS